MKDHNSRPRSHRNNPAQMLHPNDLKAFHAEVKLGGMHTVPAYMASRWGISTSTAKMFINGASA